MGKDRSYDQCNAIGCETTRDDGKKLLACSGCGIARYCSKACQKADWKNHKLPCQRHRLARTVFAGKQPAASSSQSPRHKPQDIYMRVSKWILKHRPSLGDAMVSSMDIPNNPQQQRKQVLEVSVKYLPNQDDEHCLVITSIERGWMDVWAKHASPDIRMAMDARKQYEIQSVSADPEIYGTGLVFLQVFQERDKSDGSKEDEKMHGEEFLFIRCLPISFDHIMATEIPPEKDSVWQEDLLRKTGCIPLIEAGLSHTCCSHCKHD